MPSRVRAGLDSIVTRLAPSFAAHLKLWRRTRVLEGSAGWSGAAGVDYREAEQLERIRGWARYSELFAGLRRDATINLGALDGPVSNPWFATPDAEVYAAMIGDLAPKHIVEIGAGFSTRVARRAVDAIGLSCPITVVDPSPRAEVADVADAVVRQQVQAIDLERLPLEPGTLLFVDSSHVAVPGGDVPYVYGCLIPRLPPGTFVHAHDVFLPFDYPLRARRALYTEQYVLHALLCAAPRYRVLLATFLLSSLHRAELARAIPGVAAGTGGSFWFGVEARD